MRKTLMTAVLSFVLVGASFARSSVGDWQTVRQDIPRGWQITVVTSFTFPCVFQQATDQELICSPLDHDRRGSDNGEIHVRRDRIREIRVEKREGANMVAGAAGGAGLGTLLGALLIPGARGPSAYLFGLGGASIGARSGRGTHILHGKVIYRRPVADKNTVEVQPARSVVDTVKASAQTSP
jgi:hypothetical protein